MASYTQECHTLQLITEAGSSKGNSRVFISVAPYKSTKEKKETIMGGGSNNGRGRYPC